MIHVYLLDRGSLPQTCQCHTIVFTPSHSLYTVIVSPTECIAMDFVDTYTVGILTRLVMIGNPVRIISSIYKGYKIH